jgi:hypothetical protein
MDFVADMLFPSRCLAMLVRGVSFAGCLGLLVSFLVMRFVGPAEADQETERISWASILRIWLRREQEVLVSHVITRRSGVGHRGIAHVERSGLGGVRRCGVSGLKS